MNNSLDITNLKNLTFILLTLITYGVTKSCPRIVKNNNFIIDTNTRTRD